MSEREDLAKELRWEANRWHQEYGLGQYLVLKIDMQKLQRLAKEAADALESSAEGARNGN